MKWIVLACVLGAAFARCPNDCSGRGICNAGSVCECERNWAGTDCSERVCYYALAFVDSPLGDIDGSDDVSTKLQTYIHHNNAPVGEQYDPHYGLARTTNTDQWDEAHFYRECSNKGICDRATGLCDCFAGFEGEGCQRLSCPNDCSGKGQCVVLGNTDSSYAAWDADKTVGCQCDPGYTGPDCSMRKCPIGVDPLENVYTDTSSVYRITWGTATGALHDTSTDSYLPNGAVLWTITITDDYGDSWTTSAVTTYYNAQAECSDNSDTSCESVPAWYDDGGYDYSDDAALDQSGLTDAMYDASNIAEQVNASVQALPNDVVRNSYVWVVDSTSGHGNVIYPYYEVPDSGFDAADCVTGDGCSSTDLSSADGPSVYVNDAAYRFPFWNNEAATVSDFSNYTNCAAESVCVFLKLGDPKGSPSRQFEIDYKFQTILDESSDFNSREIAGSTYDDSASLVEIREVGSAREWWSSIDGSPTFNFDSAQTMHTCSKRGMCDYASGLCNCLEGYSGFRCDKRSTTGIY